MKTVQVEQVRSCLRHRKVRVAGNVIDVKCYESKNDSMAIIRIDENSYYVVSTGEVKQFNKQNDRSEGQWRMRTSMDNLRAIINANVTGGRNCAWFTVTYRDNMTDHKQLYTDWEKFWKRLNYKRGYKMEYISVAEPQERGAWHLHVILIRPDGEKLYIPQKELLETWGHGGVNIKRLDKSDNLGAYLTAYLMNIPVTDENGNMKAFRKGARLHLYPAMMNFYRCSKGIVRPEWTYSPDIKTTAIIESASPNYRQITEVIDDDGKRVQTIVHEQYNMKR